MVSLAQKVVPAMLVQLDGLKDSYQSEESPCLCWEGGGEGGGGEGREGGGGRGREGGRGGWRGGGREGGGREGGR